MASAGRLCYNAPHMVKRPVVPARTAGPSGQKGRFMDEKKTSRLYRLIRWLVRLFSPKFRVVGAENLPDEPCVIVGRCASELLKGSNVLSVFIYADEQDCAARVMQRNQLNEHEAAKRIKHVDRMRKKYFACYADSEWGQPESYDLMLSSSKFGIDGCVELILGSLAQMKGEASVE